MEPGSGGTQGIFEMLWDCEYCGTRGLLGKSHRHCPKCGAPQDPARRYFPPPGEEVAARNTDYDGVDRTCPACQSPCSARAEHCSNCGSPLTGARPVALVAEPSPAPPPAAASLPAAGRRTGRGCLLFLAIALVGVVVLAWLLSWKKATTVTVAAHSWSREIAIERLEAVSESSWCDQLPRDAYGVRRSREVRSHRQVPDGERCHTVRTDRGDGTFEQHEQCETVYRQEPVYDHRCHYQVDRWREARSLASSGRSLAETPTWPVASLPLAGADCNRLGCERPGSRRERYRIELRSSDGKRFTCDVSEEAWRRHRDGTARPMRIGVVSGKPDCASLLR